jgi:flagellar basal-body rod protein FlgC
MAFDDLFRTANISASGLAAERMRMEVVANNIANAHSTRGPDGGPYRRQHLVFASMVDDIGSNTPNGATGLRGVQVLNKMDDPSEFPRIYQPGHPDADGEGFVAMPNVFLPMEMVDLMTASRAYEANVKVMQMFREQMEQALSILR